MAFRKKDKSSKSKAQTPEVIEPEIIEPEIIETIAPMAKAIAVHTPWMVRKVMIMNMIAAKTIQIQYSCFKNYFAP